MFYIVNVYLFIFTQAAAYRAYNRGMNSYSWSFCELEAYFKRLDIQSLKSTYVCLWKIYSEEIIIFESKKGKKDQLVDYKNKFCWQNDLAFLI